ncbi:bifunctional molybdopterin-guanine dinucleotide biosynthesis adaptor protein MobB/molybdopterin molybdotransferase MoeA [Vibrio sp. CK2-1]|uniref:bifunctional molybdopterin-guanine dinucleotide biosynthesis adaptor protein MobB/molybdopterin molybdotransferase MoeA n=1 Tax=Vibrio sp. CK2-1 TaxID=2912249 RepID=UPI001F015718|nr:bifunctional molybdopterin-guanine dinucleotide biosynthesis adaptor protein MobB/molybdopterin molybdotransferase MoeA [Vibrio sp. CK2-1]MCF7353354.1 bifunctional molybdopterin-guanine dinucleotide biosynthesis adaptor protein MobB/molybdopterin molybdotransferase MoeA [Vibrio sp. CK2-1]
MTSFPIPVLGFAAYSGTGKTTLLEALLPKLTAKGLRIGVFKHAHHDFDIDQPGKDSHRLRKAGATQMLIASRNRHALMTETPEKEANFFKLLEQFDLENLDFILVEGCKNLSFPKIELHREVVGKPWLHPHDDNIFAIASDSAEIQSPLPHVDINDLDAICELVESFVLGSNISVLDNNLTKSSTAASCDTLSPAFLSVEQGLDKILSTLKQPKTTEQQSLFKARLNVIGKDIISPINVPAYCNSAMDGYALRGQDILDGMTSFDVVTEILAGSGYANEIQTGQAAKIMTGAPMPQGADTVIMREQSQLSENGTPKIVKFTVDIIEFKVGQNVRQAGEDLAQNSVVFSQGTRITSPELGMLASLGISHIPVYPQLKVAVFSTGDEVQAPGEALNDHCIYDSNRFTVMAQLERLGCEVIDLGIIEDNEAALESTLLEATAQADAIISSGGVSVGDADFIKAVLDKIGQINFWRINMRPGRPLAFGHINDTPFFGLPGNPVAVMVSFLAFVEPALRLMQGEKNWQPVKLKAETESKVFSRLGRTEFTRGIYHLDDFGQLKVRTTGKQGSGILRSMSEANCIIEIPPHVEFAKEGEMVTILPLEGRL